jgi:hypothetical protein
MNHPSNTPPNGDFARYIEQVAGNNPLVVREDMRQPQKAQQPATFVATTAPAVKNPLAPLMEIAWAKHVRWLIAAWVATQVLTRFVPHAGWLIVPILIGYACWLILEVNQKSGCSLFKRAREMAEKAIAESKKS